MFPVYISILQSKNPGLWLTLENPDPQECRTLENLGPSIGQDSKGLRILMDSES